MRPSGGLPPLRSPWASVGLASRETTEVDPCNGTTVYTDTVFFRNWIYTTMVGIVRPCTCPPATRDAASNARMDALKPHITISGAKSG